MAEQQQQQQQQQQQVDTPRILCTCYYPGCWNQLQRSVLDDYTYQRDGRPPSTSPPSMSPPTSPPEAAEAGAPDEAAIPAASGEPAAPPAPAQPVPAPAAPAPVAPAQPAPSPAPPAPAQPAPAHPAPLPGAPAPVAPAAQPVPAQPAYPAPTAPARARARVAPSAVPAQPGPSPAAGARARTAPATPARARARAAPPPVPPGYKTFYRMWRPDFAAEEKWRQFMGLLTWVQDDSRFVCADHFRPRDFHQQGPGADPRLRRLRQAAVPRRVRASFGALHQMAERQGAYHPRVLGGSTLFTRDQPCSPGLNGEALLWLHEQSRRLEPQELVCSLLLDEVPVIKRGDGEGVADRPCPNYKCMVMMLRGLRSDWRLILGYQFTSEPYDPARLPELLTRTVAAVQHADFKLVAITLDWHSFLLPGVEKFCCDSDDRRTYYKPRQSGEQRIYLYFDPARLMRATRNCLLNHEIHWGAALQRVSRPSFTADFEAMKRAYVASRELPRESYLLPRLTRDDFDWFTEPTRLERIDVALKHLSRSMARAIEHQVCYDRLPRDCLDTAYFVERLDRLYDSLQGVELEPRNNDNKPMKSAVHRTSDHMAFWSEMRAEMRDWQIDGAWKDVARMQRPNQGWCDTINATQAIWRVAQDEHGFRHMATKYLDLEPMERMVCYLETRITRPVPDLIRI
ncbi:uncharacterized protein LOC106653896 [Trichogramma pretiosum]|uniref:uncharacterized protein LOC106653896 n=1 Tax=Trichogramma pretiosum TaxID=7493 RepID=UPI0006C99812|nr:uncharacterized protein LOC106653896 [Trichogramma pretiosum]